MTQRDPIIPPPWLVEKLEAEVDLHRISLSQAIERAYAAGAWKSPMTECSSEAKAVLNAYSYTYGLAAPDIAAAILRAATDQVVPYEDVPKHIYTGDIWAADARQEVREGFLSIAAELENS